MCIRDRSIKNHTAIQLPHHGKLVQAEEIFAVKGNDTVYYVSDNTGDTNGGSEKLKKAHPRGRAIQYTQDGDQICNAASFKTTAPISSYGWK